MSDAVELCANRANAAELTGHLARCDAAFVPPLSGRVVIRDYAQKLTDKAVRFEAWQDGELVGLVATYCNDPEKTAAFITSVSVLPSWQGRGIAAQLMARCLDHVRQEGFRRIELEVDHRSLAAVSLYEKFGFVTTRTSDSSLVMTMALGK